MLRRQQFGRQMYSEIIRNGLNCHFKRYGLGRLIETYYLRDKFRPKVMIEILKILSESSTSAKMSLTTIVGPGPCITNVIATCRKNFSQWKSSFLWKLRYHWLKFLRRVAKTLVIQGPGPLKSGSRASSAWHNADSRSASLTRSIRIRFHFRHRTGRIRSESDSPSWPRVAARHRPKTLKLLVRSQCGSKQRRADHTNLICCDAWPIRYKSLLIWWLHKCDSEDDYALFQV